MVKRKNILEVPVFDGDDGIKYIRYYDSLKMLKKIKQKEDKAIRELESIRAYASKNNKRLLLSISEIINILQGSDEE